MKTGKNRGETPGRKKGQPNRKTEQPAAKKVPGDSLTRTKAILNAALRVWELKQPGRGGTSVWQRRSATAR